MQYQRQHTPPYAIQSLIYAEGFENRRCCQNHLDRCSLPFIYSFLADISEFPAAFADHSALLKHELAYCLGQMKKTSALPTLESVLRDTSEDPIVRHEVKEPM